MQIRRHAALIPTMLVAGTLVLASPAQATTVDISYTGAGDFGGSGFTTATGTGSFTLAGDPAEVTLADITAFSFTLDMPGDMPGAAPVSYGLADLPAFEAVAPHGALIALLPPTGASLWSETLETVGADSDADFEGTFDTFGSLTLSYVYYYGTTVPEPATLAVFGVGLATLGWRRRR